MNTNNRRTPRFAPKPLRLTLTAGAALAAALALTGCQSGQIHNNMMNSAQENELGRDSALQIDSQVRFVMDGKVNRRVLDIATPIFAQAQKDRPDVSFRIRVIDSPEINAFSIPGGYVYLYRGLMDKIGDDDDALACVIGHESAHVVRRHVVKSIADSENKGFLVDLASVLSRSNAVSQVGGTLFELDQLHYSREAEFEADRWGEKFAYNAGFDPSGMIRTFQLLEAEDKKYNQPAPYSQDHPINENRILRAEAQLRELRVNHGAYIEEGYKVGDDKIAAQKNGVDYPALLLSTRMPSPASIMAKGGEDVRPATPPAPAVTPKPATQPQPVVQAQPGTGTKP